MARPIGSTTRPQIRNYLNKKDIDSLVEKARQLAIKGDQIMLKFLLEQIFGRAAQPLTGKNGGDLVIKFNKVLDSIEDE